MSFLNSNTYLSILFSSSRSHSGNAKLSWCKTPDTHRSMWTVLQEATPFQMREFTLLIHRTIGSKEETSSLQGHSLCVEEVWRWLPHDRDACKDVQGELSMGTNESSYFGILLCKKWFKITRKFLFRMIGQENPKFAPSIIFGSQFKLPTMKEST